MLINSLVALNFRKYHKLSVTDIPDNGVITIAGLNESGKTSIGEAICFALYGRTFFLDEKNLHKIVCWGTDISEVTLEFTTGKGEQYELWRSVDRDGENFVKLHRKSADTDSKQVIVDQENVADALVKLLGFDYDAFANSFYLAQRELTSPDPNSDTIKQMAGISAYAKITDDFLDSNQKHEDAIEELKPQVASTQAELDEINLDETWLPELIEADEVLGSEQNQRETLVGALKDKRKFYSENLNNYHKHRKFNSFGGILGKILFPVALVAWLLWLANKYFKENFSGFLSKILDETQLSQFTGFADSWMLPIATISLVLYFLNHLMRKRSRLAMHQLQAEANDFAGSLKEGHRYVTTLVETLLPERVVQNLHDNTPGAATLQILPPREQFNNLARLIDKVPEFKTDEDELNAAVTRLSDALVKQDGEIIEIEEQLLGDISEEKARSDQAGHLRSSLQGLNKVIDKCRYSIETQNIAIGLMQRAAKDSVELFNKNIADLSADTLPKFTESRYSKVRIEEDFSVQIYSDEKQDFMDFDEISSGTQRQVMLALRMAMSAELAVNTGNEHQFIFLDEPFAFFDQARTKATLRALPDVSDVITQVWISAQEFPDDIEVAKQILCPIDGMELIV